MPGEHNIPTKTAWEALEYNDSIRLLQLQPAKARESTLHGELQLTTLSAYEREISDLYIAISYVWGDPEQVDEVRLGHTRVGITANLGAALRDIRDVNKVLTIWVDAMCINQDDISERNQQVRIMGEIYRQASSTIIYLGPTSQDIDLLFDTSIERKRLDPANYNQLIASIDKKWTFEEKPRLSKAIDDLCSREWFTRSWVFQELVLSKHPRIQCGQRRLQWDTLMPLIQSYSDRQGHCRLALAMDKARENRNGLSFYNLLVSRAHSKATDPRDFFYSVIGLASDRQLVEKIVPVDYAILPKDVFVRAARYLLQGSCNLKAIASCCNLSTLGEGLPSWVPDWGVQTKWLLQPHSWMTNHHVNDILVCRGYKYAHKTKRIANHFFSSSDIPPSLRDHAGLLKSALDRMTPYERSHRLGTTLSSQIRQLWQLWDAFVALNVGVEDKSRLCEIQDVWPQISALHPSNGVPHSEAKLGVARVVCEYVDQFSHPNIGYGYKRLGGIFGWPVLLSSKVGFDDDVMYIDGGFFIMRPVRGVSVDLEMGDMKTIDPRLLTHEETHFWEKGGWTSVSVDGIHQNFKIIATLGKSWWELPESLSIFGNRPHYLHTVFIL